MHATTLDTWKHPHAFDAIHDAGESRTHRVLFLTAVTMILEIAAGTAFGSMALLADGWHMATHVAAFFIAILTYRYTRRHQRSSRFTFGTGKVTVLGGFASAIVLLVVALAMAIESLGRFYSPQEIHFNEAILVALLGLAVNILSALILKGHHEHHDHHGNHSHHGAHRHEEIHDHTLKAAYLHVLADALTSLLALVALFSGKLFGWGWTDPLMGIVGALVITHWSLVLLNETRPILLDENTAEDQAQAIRSIIESDADNRICDLHLWKVGPDDNAAIVSLVTHFPRPVEHYKTLLRGLHGLSHLTIEVHRCTSEPCIPPASPDESRLTAH